MQRSAVEAILDISFSELPGHSSHTQPKSSLLFDLPLLTLNAGRYEPSPHAVLTPESYNLSLDFQSLRLCLLLRLQCLLAIAPNHDHGQEAPHHSTSEKYEDDGYANGPDSRREERL